MFKKLRFLRVIDGRDNTIHYTTLLLALFGVVMGVSAGMSEVKNSLTPLIVIVIKQLIYFIISYFFMIFASKLFDYKLIKRYLPFILIASFVLLVLPRAFPSVGGSYAWLRFNFFGTEFTIQPAEFIKVVMIVLLAIYLGDLRVRNSKWTDLMFAPFVVLMTFVIIIVLVQNDFGTAMVLILVSFICVLIPSHPSLRPGQRIIAIIGLSGMALVAFLMSTPGIEFIKVFKLQPYQIARFVNADNPFNDRYDGGYQLVNSLIAFSNGGLFGSGLGRSMQKYGYLPEGRTDFILAIIAEELGFVGVMVIILLYLVLIYRLIYFALKIKSEKDKMVLVGVASYLFIHFVFNIGGVTALIPLTGVPLLLISSGGSSMMAVMMAVGICQSIIARYKKGEVSV